MTVNQVMEHILELLATTGETLGPAEIARRLASQGKLGSGNHNTQRGRVVTACGRLVEAGRLKAVPLERGGHHYRAVPAGRGATAGTPPRAASEPANVACEIPPARPRPRPVYFGLEPRPVPVITRTHTRDPYGLPPQDGLF